MKSRVTNRAIITVLYALGLDPQYIQGVMNDYFEYSYNNLTKFEEIRHHEIRLFYPNVYTQNKYMDRLK